MKGSEVRQILADNKVNLAKLAAELGITPQALSSRLNADVFKRAYLIEMTQVLGRDLFGVAYQDYSHLLDLLSKKDEQIDRLISIIENLGGKAPERK